MTVLSAVLTCFMLVLLINGLFFISMNKQKWDLFNSSSFECGFSFYFFSHFSFSIHFYVVALIFLFLDLELCVLMPFFNDFTHNYSMQEYIYLILVVLLLGLLYEWKEGKLEWMF